MKEKIESLLKKFLNKQVIMYIIFGVLTTLVNLGISFFLEGVFNINGAWASAIGIMASIIFAYFTNRKWVFESQASNKKEKLNEFIKFILGRALTMIIEQGGVIILYSVMNLPFAPVKLSLTIIVIVLNFFFSKFFAFKKNEKKTNINIKEKILNNKKDIYIFIGMTIFSIIICANFLRTHFAADTYCLNSYGYHKYLLHFLNSARIFSALELWISQVLDITLLTNLKIMNVIAIGSMALSWFILYRYSIKLLQKEKSVVWNILIGLVSFSIIFTFSSCELMMFAESGIMGLSILLSIIAACIFNSNVKHRYIWSWALVLLASFAYQSTIALFVLVALVMESYRNNDDIKKIVKEALMIGLIYGISLVINLGVVKIIENIQNSSMRTTTIPQISEIINTIIEYGALMAYNTFNLIPKGLYLGIIGIISIVFIYNVYKSKKYFNILEYVMLIFLAFIMPLLPVIVTPQEQQYLQPRMVPSFASVLGILILYIICKMQNQADKNNTNKSEKIINKILVFISTFLVVMNSIYFIYASTENRASAYLDRNVAKSIIEEIYEYENENQIKIENIGLAWDKNPSNYYNGQPTMESANVRSMVIEWSAIEVMEFYSGEKYNKVETPSNIIERFAGENWDFYNQDQLVFEGNTLYICLF